MSEIHGSAAGLQVQVSPMTDIDSSFIYNTDGTVQQIIQTLGAQTKTTVFSYVNGVVQGIAVVLT